ncbi:MAG: hypothetical protein M8467_12365 [Anaerolineae bacterium]|nr:hypothetical protein [Anaerolineae bacterium]
MAEQDFPLEIRDPELDADELACRVRESVAQRRAEGAYGPDVKAIGPNSLKRGPGGELPGDYTGLQQSLAELLGQGHLAEPDFTSRVPVIGGLIVLVRRLWNWMSTKWYVRPLVEQQSAVNVQTAQLLGELLQGLEIDGQRLSELEARVAMLEARLEVRAGE